MRTVFERREQERRYHGQRYRARLTMQEPVRALARAVVSPGGVKAAIRPVSEEAAPDGTRGASAIKPFRILEMEISQPLPDIAALDARTGQRYEHALALVRLHGRPLGLVELVLGHDRLPADRYAYQIWHALQAEIMEHLRQDWLPAPATLTASGLPATAIPLCEHERGALLANAPFVSIVVATHDRPESLATCLCSLLSLNYPHYEIIVVDNRPSSDAAVEVVRRARGGTAPIRYVREDRPGLACAHNRGLRDVRGEIVAFTDDDVVVDPQWLAELVRGFNADERVGCVTGLIIPMELQTPSQLWIEQFGGFSKGFRQRVFNLDTHPRSALFPYAAGSFGSGANMAFRTASLHRIGGFDPALGAGSMALGGDDLAAFFQVIAAGYTLVYQPPAIVYHPHRREYTGLQKQVYGYGVGLTAYLTKIVIERPGRIPDLARRIPHGLVYALSARSPKNARKRLNYPRELTTLERKGMLYGPLAYLRARRYAHTRTAQRAWSQRGELLPTAATQREKEQTKT